MTVNVSSVPAVAGSGAAVFVTRRSALRLTVVVDVELSFALFGSAVTDEAMDAGRPMPVAYHFDRFILDLGRGALLSLDRAELALRPKSFALLLTLEWRLLGMVDAHVQKWNG